MSEVKYELVCKRCEAKYSSNIVWDLRIFMELRPTHDCLREKWNFNSPGFLMGDDGTTHSNG